jgi:formate C-acetyltransferase
MQTQDSNRTLNQDASCGGGAPVKENRLADWLTPAIVRAKLNAMAAMFNYRPSLRRHLSSRHPSGAPFVFEAVFEFVTLDRKRCVHAVFSGGKMKVHAGPAERADVTVRFRTPLDMRRFFAGADSFNMLLDKSLLLEGNMSYLFKFGHMSAALKNGKKGKPAGKNGGGWPERWQDLKTYPVGLPCEKRPEGEVRWLEDPFLADRSLNDFPAVKRLLWGYRVAKPAICSERPRLLTEYILKSRGNGSSADRPVLRQAKALRHILANRRPIIRDDDLLAGTTTAHRIGVLLFPELGGTGIWPELTTVDSRRLNPYDISGEEIEILNSQVFPYWMDDNIREWTRKANNRPDVLQLDERFVFYFMWKTQAASHTVIDVPRALRRGLKDIITEAGERERSAKEAEKRDFYRAVAEALEGVIEYSNHLADRAAFLAEREAGDGPESADRRKTLLEMERICRKVPAGPAESLHEATQAIWTLLVAQHQENMNAGMVVGRLDTWLQPYFEREMAGAADAAEVKRRTDHVIELVCALMLKLTDHLPLVPDVGNRLFGGSSENQVITLGGLTADGRSAVCDMTWIFLKATEMLHLRDPNINARFAPGVNTEAYLKRLCEVNLLTAATPSLHNDDAIVPALINQGMTPEHARDWTATGCVEPTSCGRHFGHTNCMMFNLVAPLEMAMNGGVHPSLGEQIGPRTPAVGEIRSYGEFLEVYKTQLGWLIDKSAEANNMLGRAHQAVKPTPLLSALFTGPMESGRDVIEGGALYNTSGAAMIGLTDVVDSLATIKVLVFDRGQVDFRTLFTALAEDFAGHEQLLAAILNKVPKFGQDDPMTNEIADLIVRFVYDRFQAQTHYRGGKYLPGYWSMSNHVAFGMFSGALPSGRRRGKPFTPGLTPSHLSRASLTDHIRSVARLENLKTPNNIAFNVKVVPGAKDSHREVVDRMAAYVASYFNLGGMQLQFNVVSSGTMRAAMENPDGYRDLLVRISGYNAYFVELNRDIQMELVERAEHSLGMGR